MEMVDHFTITSITIKIFFFHIQFSKNSNNRRFLFKDSIPSSRYAESRIHMFSFVRFESVQALEDLDEHGEVYTFKRVVAGNKRLARMRFREFHELFPYRWSSFLSARADRAHRSAVLLTPCRTLGNVLPIYDTSSVRCPEGRRPHCRRVREVRTGCRISSTGTISM